MTEPITIDIHQLVQEGRAAALAGDTFAARASFRRATELDPKNISAWIGLSSVVPVLSEKREYLRQALALDPQHAEALASLSYVDRLIGEGLQLAPSQRRVERVASGDASPLLGAPEAPAVATEVEYCYIHPDRETGLHCVQCNRPICGTCATPASVGQLCPECRKARRPSNYQVTTGQLVIGGVVAFIAAALVAFLVLLFARGFLAFLLIIFAGPAVAELIVRVIDRATRNKRGRSMQISAGAGVALGALAVGFWFALTLPLILFTVLAIVTVVARLR